MNHIWESFFSRTFSLAEEAIHRGDLTKDDVLGQEPWLYLGLPASNALDSVLRSPPTGPFRLALGERDVGEECVPEEGRRFFGAFMQLRDALHAAKLSPRALATLRQKVLWGERDDRVIDPALLTPVLSRLASGVQGIAIMASQEKTFKDRFNEVMTLLSAIV